MARITLDYPRIRSARNRAIAQLFQGRPSSFGGVTREDCAAVSYFDLRMDDQNWHLKQSFPPLFHKQPNWRRNILDVLEGWAGKVYTPGQRECFLFACSALDAMLGSSLYNKSLNRWNSIEEFYVFARRIGTLDFFDFIGDRTLLGHAQPGDLIQHETEIDGKVYLHWGIAAEAPGTEIMFARQGLCECRVGHTFATHTKFRVWALRNAKDKTEYPETALRI